MTRSPFHGIFSALSRSAAESDLSPLSLSPHLDGKAATTPPQGGGADGIGRVAVDIYEQDGYIIVKAPIAGARLSDLDIDVNDTILTIRGERKQTDAIPPDQYYLRECFWGPFSRSITLPFPIDAKKVKATFNRDCILKIVIAKEEKVKIVRISEA